MKYVTFSCTDIPATALSCCPAESGTDEQVEIAEADIRINQHFLQPAAASQLFRELHDGIEWQQDSITLFGKTHRIPRLHQWYGDTGTVYKWSGIRMQPRPWSDALMQLRKAVELYTGAAFNCVLANLYRDGNDSMGWHADDEPELGVTPVIASISLGAERDFLLRRRQSVNRASKRIRLNHGSLLIMAGPTQRNWQHALPKRKRETQQRINLTFRYVRQETV